MLDELLVTNLGVIASAHLEPGPGLVAVTGETGAGKTLLLGALRLLRGDQARSDQIGPHDDEARVEGRFILEGDEEITLARRLTSSRSRAYVDGTMTPIATLAERLDSWVEIIGQNEHVSIGSRTQARAILDGALDASGREASARYRKAWSMLAGLRADRDALGGDRRAMERQRDLADHQANEIAAARLSVTEAEELEVQLGRLRHGQEIAEALGRARDLLVDDDGAEDRLRAAHGSLHRPANHDAEIRELMERVDNLADWIADAAAEMRRIVESLDTEPGALEAAERRKAVLSDLERKYGDSMAEVIEFGLAASERAASIGQLLARAEQIDDELAEAELMVTTAAEGLREARLTAAKTLSEATAGHLRDLGFRDPLVRFTVEPVEPAEHGADRIDISFASDSSLTPGPVARVASGGELSRLVLAVRLAAGIGDAPIIAFDEVDAGIGGATALAMGEKLAALAQGRQVLVVTHLPQVAAFADTHIVVRRDGGRADVEVLDHSSRRAELARMLGGLDASEGGLLHAAELLAEADRRRRERSVGG